MVQRPYLEAVTTRLEALGFRKRRAGVFTIELANNVDGWVGLNTATRHRPPGEVEVNPVVGVRHRDIENLVADLRGEKRHAYLPPTISTPLGYVTPAQRYLAWVFSPGTEAEQGDALVAAVAAHGLDYMRVRVDLTELCRSLAEKGAGPEHQIAYRRAVAWLLAGDRNRARQLLADAVTALGVRTDLAAAELRRFSTRFLEYADERKP